MTLRFRPHAVSRMLERGISVEEVEAIVEKPDGRIYQSHDKSILYKKLKGRKDNLIAAVVLEEQFDGVIEVITVLVNFEVKI